MSKGLPTAKIEGLFICESPDDFLTVPRDEIELDLDGVVGDQRHRGRSKPADIRLRMYRKNRDTVLNRQTISIVDGLSLDEIADEIQLDPETIAVQYAGESRRTFLARCLGANILLGEFRGGEGVEVFHDLPNATDFGPVGKDGKFDVSVMITRYNEICAAPAEKVAERYPLHIDMLAASCLKAAVGKRGFVGMPVLPGRLLVGQEVTFAPLPAASRRR